MPRKDSRVSPPWGNEEKVGRLGKGSRTEPDDTVSAA